MRWWVTVLAGLPASLLAGSCNDLTSCGSCMEDPACSWCSDPPPFDGARCSGSWAQGECSQVVDLESRLTVQEDTPLNLNSTSRQFVQIQPQAADIFLRPGRPVNISFTVGHAENFPVDLYFLMD